MLQVIRKNESSPQIAPESTVLDIETTGLHRATDAVFLVGLQTAEEFRQWLAPSRDEEGELLEAIRPFLADKTLITYNGDHFDLPFLQERFAVHGIAFPSILSQDWFAYLRPRRLFFRFPNLRLSTLARIAGLMRQDPYTGAQIATFSKHLEDPEAKDAVLLHNEEDVRELALLLPVFQEWQQQLQLEVPIRASLEALEPKGDQVTMHYRSEMPARPEWHTENSFGSLHWVEQDLYCSVPTHRLDASASAEPRQVAHVSSLATLSSPSRSSSDTLRLAAVSPSYAEDAAVPPLPKPFLTLSSSEGYFASNCHLLVRDLFSLGKA